MNSRRRQFWKKCDQDFEMRVEQIYNMFGKDHIPEFSSFATPRFVDRNPSLKWEWGWLSQNPSITANFVERNGDKPWSWFLLSGNPSITPEFIEKKPEYRWNWTSLSMNPSITSEFVEKNFDKPWCWDYLSENPSITPEFVERNLDKCWNWEFLSKNPSITPEFVERNFEKLEYRWDWNRLSRNPSITPEFVEKNSSKPWNWRNFYSVERVNFEKQKVIDRNLKFHLSIYRIQYWWRNILENPNYDFSYRYQKRKIEKLFESSKS